MPKKTKKTLGRKDLQRTRGGVKGDGAVPPISFSPGLSSSQQVSEVHVRAWDPVNRKEIVGK